MRIETTNDLQMVLEVVWLSNGVKEELTQCDPNVAFLISV
jgi:hypothetical protein